MRLYLGGELVGRVTDIEGPVYRNGHTEGSGLVKVRVNPFVFPGTVLPFTKSTKVVQELKFVGTPTPPWWTRALNRLLEREPASYVVASAPVYLVTMAIRDPGYDGATFEFKVAGPTTTTPLPVSRLEALWTHVCTIFH